MKKRYSILKFAIFFLLTPFISKAQQACKDTIHLKNGQLVCGRIIDIQKPFYLVILVNDSVAYMYSWRRIKYVRSCSHVNSHLLTDRDMTGLKRSKLFLSLELEETLIISQIDTSTVNFVSTPKISIGYNLKNEMAVGFGVGLFQYNHADFIPLYAEFRKYYFEGSFAGPYLEGDAGYTICNEPNEDKGGVNINARIGLKTPYTKRLDLFGNFGLGFQQYSFYQVGEGSNQLQQKSFLVLNLNIGVMID